jgi:2-polyprenyl-6-methoxyphenol hydroxylase-like FAD-dependent oxidoreductase
LPTAKSVLISGTGIAGPTLAYWLNAAGFKTTLVEHAPELRQNGYVIDFWGLGYDIAERMGLLAEINRIGYHMREMRIVDGAGLRNASFGTRVFEELTGGRYVTLGRGDLSKLLFEKTKGSTEAIFGDEIVGLREESDQVRVQFKHRGERGFDLVIGADGLHSGVRRPAFGPQDRFEKRLGYLVAVFETSGYRPRDEDIYVMYCEPGRMVGRVTLRDDKTLFLFVFTAGPDADPADLAARKAVLRARYGDGQWECPRILDALEGTGDLYFDRVSQIKMDRWSQGRIALVGDAAFCVSLLAGQGSALAMTAAYVLAGELAKAGGNYQEAFSSYENILRSFIESKQKAAARYAGALAPRTRWGLIFRNLVVNAAAIPGVARLAFGKDILDKLELPDYRWPANRQPDLQSGS